jgi:hypothetical protein
MTDSRLKEGLKVRGEYCGIPYKGIITAIRFAPGRGHIHSVDFTPPIDVSGLTGKPNELRMCSEIHTHPDFPNGKDGNTIYQDFDPENLTKYQREFLQGVIVDAREILQAKPDITRDEMEQMLPGIMKGRLARERALMEFILSDDPEALKCRDELAEETWNYAHSKGENHG